MKLKKGDTLIEVALAIGIFSLVAISIVSVVTASTSGAQSSLEATVAKEEVDSQAEALRFIHESYLSGSQDNAAGNDRYTKVWQALIAGAKDQAESLVFRPATCKELYEPGKLDSQGAFLINLRQLGQIELKSSSELTSFIPGNIVMRPTASDNGIFTTATTYPRLLYGGLADNASLLAEASDESEVLTRAEGIYIVAIKDQESTVIVDDTGTAKKAAYYDFYIRTCWFSPGADRPSSTSTVVRLYDPSVIVHDEVTDQTGDIEITFLSGLTGVDTKYTQKGIAPGSEVTLRTNTFTREGYHFAGWAQTPGASAIYADGQTITAPSSNMTLYAVWEADDIPYIQEVGLKQCQTEASSSPLAVRDRRDDQHYTVRYLESKKGSYCWMTENLRITGQISSEFSNFEGDSISVKVQDLAEGGKVYDIPRAHYEGTSTYYNLCAASARQPEGCTDKVKATITQDICPAGWHIPTDSEATALRSATSTVRKNFNSADGSNGGYYNPIKKPAQALISKSRNYWWTATSYTKDRNYAFYSSSSNDSSTITRTYGSMYKYLGLSIRCVRTSD